MIGSVIELGVLNCEHCNGKAYEDGAITRTTEGKTGVFCSENCAESFEGKGRK